MLKPRMKIFVRPGPTEDELTLGRYRTSSSKSVTFRWLRVSPVSAWIAIGTFWTFSVRRCAVTTISSIEPPASADWSAAPAERADGPDIDAKNRGNRASANLIGFH